jgi:hypothetical protein
MGEGSSLRGQLGKASVDSMPNIMVGEVFSWDGSSFVPLVTGGGPAGVASAATSCLLKSSWLIIHGAAELARVGKLAVMDVRVGYSKV